MVDQIRKTATTADTAAKELKKVDLTANAKALAALKEQLTGMSTDIETNNIKEPSGLKAAS